MGNSLSVEAFRVEQNGFEFYTFVMNSKRLREIASVSTRTKETPQGYQRVLSAKRLTDIGLYIKGKRSTFPGSIIVNLEKGATFHPGKTADFGTLEIPKEASAAWVIDGQHRLWGFERAGGKEFDLVVSAFIGLTPSDQGKVFIDVNSNQKGVNTSLLYDLIDLVRDANFIDQRGHEIVKALSADDDSPWAGNIKMLGTGAGIITQAGFMRPLTVQLKNSASPFSQYTEGDQVQVLKTFFTAFSELFPEAWLSKKHTLCKTLGVSAMLSTLPAVLMHCMLRDDFALKAMKDILKGVPEATIPQMGNAPLDFTGASLAGLTGKKAEASIGAVMAGALPPLRPSAPSSANGPTG
jgi:DGQHR domain-containing protein